MPSLILIVVILRGPVVIDTGASFQSADVWQISRSSALTDPLVTIITHIIMIGLNLIDGMVEWTGNMTPGCRFPSSSLPPSR